MYPIEIADSSVVVSKFTGIIIRSCARALTAAQSSKAEADERGIAKFGIRDTFACPTGECLLRHKSVISLVWKIELHSAKTLRSTSTNNSRILIKLSMSRARARGEINELKA